jgi:hypothetical protein
MSHKLTHTTRILAAACLLAGLAGCEQRTDKEETGGVLLSISDFGTLPLQVSVSEGGLLQIDSITVSNVVKDPTGLTSQLMNVEISSYEVTFTRADRGTRVPRPFVEFLFGTVPVGGSTTFNGLNFLHTDHLRNPPLSDLALSGRDTETGSSVIFLNVHFRFFGRTLSGDVVSSQTASFTIEVVP